MFLSKDFFPVDAFGRQIQSFYPLCQGNGELVPEAKEGPTSRVPDVQRAAMNELDSLVNPGRKMGGGVLALRM